MSDVMIPFDCRFSTSATFVVPDDIQAIAVVKSKIYINEVSFDVMMTSIFDDFNFSLVSLGD